MNPLVEFVMHNSAEIMICRHPGRQEPHHYQLLLDCALPDLSLLLF